MLETSATLVIDHKTKNSGDLDALKQLSGYEFDIKNFRSQSRAANTTRAYRSDIAQFEKFCQLHSQPQALPVPEYTVASFVGWMAGRGLKAVTIQRRLSALSALHVKAGEKDPIKSVLVSETIQGLKRQRAAEGERPLQARPVNLDMLHKIAAALDNGLLDARDWAMILLGFSGLLRRSELAALNMHDIEWRKDGLVLHIRKSKSDQMGQGDVVGIPLSQASLSDNEDICPVAALRGYLDLSGHETDAVFRNHGAAARHSRINPRVVAYAVKRLAKRADIDPADFSGHSLRSGGATTLAEAGVDLGMIVTHGRWKDPKTVAKHYIRPVDALGKGNAMRGVL